MPPVQQKVKDIALTELSKITGNQMTIGELNLHPFNQLQLKEVYVSDLKNDTLLYAGNLKAGFNLWRLLDNHLLIQSVHLDNFRIKVNSDSVGGDFNFQFLIDAFASEEPDTTSTSSLSIQINDIVLKEGSIDYDILQEPFLEENNFDFNHIHLRNLSANIDLNSLDMENLDVAIKHLALQEKSGFTLKEVQAEFTSKGKRFDIEKFQLNLPQSQLAIGKAWLDYSNGELSEVIHSGSFDLILGESSIYLPDLSAFYPPLKKLTDPLTFSGSIGGESPTFSLSEFIVNYGKSIQLDITAQVKTAELLENSAFEMDLKKLFLNEKGLNTVMAFLSENTTDKLPINAGSLNVFGKAEGVLSDLKADITADCDQGSLHLEGSGGYRINSGAAHFDVQLHTENFDIETLLQDSVFGRADLNIAAKGNLSPDGKINASGDFNLIRFDYNDYAYKDIEGSLFYVGDSINAQITSHDPNIPLEIKADGNLHPNRANFNLQAQIDTLRLDTLNFLPNYNEIFLSAIIRANVEGFDPEKMQAHLEIDGLSIQTNKGSFEERAFTADYTATADSTKKLHITSKLLNARANGHFSYTGLMESVQKTFPTLFPEEKQTKKRTTKKKEESKAINEKLNFMMAIREAGRLTDILELPKEIPDSLFFMTKYSHDGDSLRLQANAFTIYTSADTLQLKATISNQEDDMGLVLRVNNRSSMYDFKGTIDSRIKFLSSFQEGIPDMDIMLNPTKLSLNDTDFDLNASEIEVRKNRYSVHNFMLAHKNDEYIKIDGTASDQKTDSLKVNISNFHLGTLFHAIKSDVPVSGNASGEIVAKRILSTPFVMSRGFNLNDIVVAENKIGDLNIRSGWSSERQGLILKATLSRENHPASVISGFVLPEKDSLSITANINEMELSWFQSFMQGTLYGMSGNLGATVKASGSIKSPTVAGKLYFNNATVGINMLNTLYSINDSIDISPQSIDLKNFVITDENKQQLIANGSIKHKQFGDLDPKIDISLRNFQLIHNEQQTDSLFYGNLKVNGLLNVRKSGKDLLLSGNITHAKNAKVMVNIPTSASSAQRYNMVTYVNSQGEDLAELEKKEEKTANAESAFPLKIQIALSVDPGLTLGVVFNPATGDDAEVTGYGLINFTYDMSSSAMKILGDYTVEKGSASLSVGNIVKRTFSVEEGGTLTFRGDPLATNFDVTALYTVRADLTVLDPSFENIGSSSKLPITCALRASGNLDKMELGYRILVPSGYEDTQKQLDNILYTDDLKIKEIAYLLAFNTFMPLAQDNAKISGGTILNSLASSSINSQLNNLLSGVLADNWSVNTDFQTADGNFSDVDMGVNVSTQLFNNRLTVNTSFGFSNNPNQSDNITGDFDIEYKLVPSGNLVLKVYNVTNNQYYEKAKNTQGVGVLYKRQGRTFKKLFDNFRTKKKVEEEKTEEVEEIKHE